MSNFWQQKVAQESAGMDVDVMEDLTHDGGPFAVEHGEVESLEKDGDALASDMEQLDSVSTFLDGVETLSPDSFDAIQMGQESIRKRWGMERSTVARESLGDNVNLLTIAQEANRSGKETLWSRFIAWLKEMANKLKERWIKFSNAGKKLSKRSVEYKKQIEKLGGKKDDKISGGFIQGLTIDNKFSGDNFALLSKQVTFAEKVQKTQADILESARSSLLDVFNLTDDKILAFYNQGSATIKLNKILKESLTSTEIVGNRYLAALEDGDFMTYELREHEGGIVDEVSTPSLPILTQACDTLYSIGKDIEKQLLSFRKTNELRLKIAGLEGKLQGTIERLGDGNTEASRTLMKMTQQLATLTISRSNALASTESYIWKNLGTSLDQYIRAGVGAYNKK